MINNDITLPDTIGTIQNEFKLYLYMTGNAPMEFGYYLYHNNSRVKQDIVGRFTQEGILGYLLQEIMSYINDNEVAVQTLLSSKFINPTNFKK
jgi:hypothetical protein